MIRAVILIGVALLLGATTPVEDAFPRTLGCLEQSEIRPDYTPSELARVVRVCTEAGRYDDAMQVYFTYSTFALYDQQRVRDESAHVVLGDLSLWMFSGYSRDVMAELKEVAAKLRDRDSAFFHATCAEIAQIGAPAYRPSYMISKGMIPLKHDEDWQHEDFDSQAAWQKALVEVNGCPQR